MYRKVITNEEELGANFVTTVLGNDSEPNNPVHTVHLSRFEVGDASGAGLNWYEAVAFAAYKNGEMSPSETVPACEEYLKECLAKNKWRLPTEAELEYMRKNCLPAFGNRITALWAIDSHDADFTGTIDGAKNPVKLDIKSDSRVMRLISSKESFRDYNEAGLHNSWSGVRLVRTIPDN